MRFVDKLSIKRKTIKEIIIKIYGHNLDHHDYIIAMRNFPIIATSGLQRRYISDIIHSKINKC